MTEDVLPPEVLEAERALAAGGREAYGNRDLGFRQSLWDRLYTGAMSKRTWARYMKVYREGHPWLAQATAEGWVPPGGAVECLGLPAEHQALVAAEMAHFRKEGHRVTVPWVAHEWVPMIVDDHLKACSEDGCVMCDLAEPLAARWAEDGDVLRRAAALDRMGGRYLKRGQQLREEARRLRAGEEPRDGFP